MAKLGSSRQVGVSRDALRKRRERELAARQTEASKPTGRQALNDDADASIKIYEPAARLAGGPRDGRVYYVSDLEQEQRAAERMGTSFDYRSTNAHTTLPHTGGVKGVIWRWKGTTA